MAKVLLVSSPRVVSVPKMAGTCTLYQFLVPTAWQGGRMGKGSPAKSEGETHILERGWAWGQRGFGEGAWHGKDREEHPWKR